MPTSGANIFSLLGFQPQEAEDLLGCAEMMDTLRDRVRGLSLADAAGILHTTEARVRQLRRGRIDLFDPATLSDMLRHCAC